MQDMSIHMEQNMYARESISKIMITNVCPQQLHLGFRVSNICQARDWPNQKKSQNATVSCQGKKKREEKKDNVENEERKNEDAKERREDAEEKCKSNNQQVYVIHIAAHHSKNANIA
jgi:hypothetical protein